MLFVEMLRASLPAATPILLAALGGLYTYHANVFNIAMEGMMLIGAFLGVLGSYLSGSWLVGLLCAIGGGGIAALLFALFAVYLKTDEFVTGIAINLLALGGTTYALRQLFDVKGAFISPDIIGLPIWDLPLIERIPVVGEILSSQPFMIYVSILIVWAVHWHLYQTRFGLRVRATGESPNAVDTIGVRSNDIKTYSLLLSGVLCGLAGGYLSLGYVTLFSENMSNGRGWVSLAVIILTRGRPFGILLMALVFGFFDGLGLALQGTAIPVQFTQMTPYLATLVALYVYVGRERRMKIA